MALWPCEPAMIRPAFHSFAYSEMALRGKPLMTSDSALCPVCKSFSEPAFTRPSASHLASSISAGSRAKR